MVVQLKKTYCVLAWLQIWWNICLEKNIPDFVCVCVFVCIHLHEFTCYYPENFLPLPFISSQPKPTLSHILRTSVWQWIKRSESCLQLAWKKEKESTHYNLLSMYLIPLIWLVTLPTYGNYKSKYYCHFFCTLEFNLYL